MPEGGAGELGPDEIVRRVEAVLQGSDGSINDRHLGVSRSFSEVVGLVQHQAGSLVDKAMRLHSDITPPQISRSLVKGVAQRAVRKAVAWFVEARLGTLAELDGVQNDALYLQEQRLSSQGEALIDMDRKISSLGRQVETTLPKVYEVLDELEKTVTKLQSRFETLVSRSHLRTSDSSLPEDVQERLRVLEEALESLAPLLAVGGEHHLDYLDFENRFRGPQDAIRESQSFYLSFIPDLSDSGKVLDVGCGRGEMLELLTQAGHTCVGIDVDAEMVMLCREKGLQVEKTDALSYLANLDEGSLKAILCNQVIEHLSTSSLKRLVKESARVLRPGGVAVFETIDPRSLFALGNHFYADLTHVRPVHPHTLAFLCESFGFERADIVQRSPHEALEGLDESGPSTEAQFLRRIARDFYGFQDYAVIAYR
jgi:2-polyprenyl-3-methyl-5-hydroxy-6-metoxy-1,4-benzoquinol methylase